MNGKNELVEEIKKEIEERLKRIIEERKAERIEFLYDILIGEEHALRWTLKVLKKYEVKK